MTRVPRLLVYCAGGLEHAGGIGRVLGNLLDASRAAARPYRMTVIDTRGPYSILVSPIFFFVALARTVLAPLTGGRVAAHVNMAHAGSTIRKVIVCWLLTVLRVPYLLHLHANNYDTYFRAQPAWRRALIQRAFHKADKIVVLGTIWRNVVVDEIGADPRKVQIIRNGAPDTRATAPIPRVVPLILFLSDLRPWKGLGELIQALASKEMRDRPWRLVCAGRGNSEQYHAAALRAGIADRISFPGWLPRDRAQELLHSANILALPSHMEGLSVTLVEALACGIPVVATAVGAHPDILRDHENAVLVKVRDPISLAQGLLCLLTDRELAEKVSRGGRILFEERLEIGCIESEFHDVYESLFRRPVESVR